MALRLEPVDEYMHALGAAGNFNESMYVNVYDPGTHLGGFLRLGNRPNEGHAEMTLCLFLPDGRVGFMFRRPAIVDNSAFDAGGMRFNVVRPFEEIEVGYRGQALLLDDPLAMADPGRAFRENPTAPCEVGVTFRGLSPMYGGEPDRPAETPGEEFATGHYEQLVSAGGTVIVGDHRWEIEGLGLRDHSWGPRSWQAPWYYRWLTGNVGPTFGFMASRVARRDGPGTRGGFVWDGTALHVCRDVTVSTGWRGEESFQDTVTAVLRSDDHEWRLQGKVQCLIPLRNRRDDRVTRIAEGLTRWTIEDRVGYGLSEYLDQIVDGRPVGLEE